MAAILIIDSEETVRAVISKILVHGGHMVRGCGELREALAMILTARPDLVLTNVYLRDTTGRGALAALKDAMPHVPVLMVSGLPDEDTIHEWQYERGFDVFPKPFRAESLLSKVSEMLKQP